MTTPPVSGTTAPVSPSDAELAAARNLLERAVREDLSDVGDLTSGLLVAEDELGAMQIVVRQRGVIAGLPFLRIVFELVDPRVHVAVLTEDGNLIPPGTAVAQVRGPVRALLTGERTALNLLTMLSGTATLTRQFVDAIEGTRAAILDTRKTLPGLRRLQKYAVRCGGGTNHRLGLYDGVLIKDNHLAAWIQAGGTALATLLKEVRAKAPAGVPIEIEVDTLEQFHDALAGHPDIILCDNMSPEHLRQAVQLRDAAAPEVKLEASGGISLASVRAIAETGVDRISIGALTHSAPAIDVACDWTSAT